MHAFKKRLSLGRVYSNSAIGQIDVQISLIYSVRRVVADTLYGVGFR